MSIQDDELVDVAKDSMITSHPKLMALHRRLLDGSLMPLELFRVMHWDEIRFEIGSMYLRHHHRPMRGRHMDVRMRRRVEQWGHFYYW